MSVWWKSWRKSSLEERLYLLLTKSKTSMSLQASSKTSSETFQSHCSPSTSTKPSWKQSVSLWDCRNSYVFESFILRELNLHWVVEFPAWDRGKSIHEYKISYVLIILLISFFGCCRNPGWWQQSCYVVSDDEWAASTKPRHTGLCDDPSAEVIFIPFFSRVKNPFILFLIYSA